MFLKTSDNIIDDNEVQWLALTKVLNVDRIGKVFSYKGKIFRAIYPEMADYVRSLFSKKIIQTLVKKDLLIDTQPTHLQLKGFPLVLWHEKITHITKPAFWPWEFYKTAGIKFATLNEHLLDWGLATCDGHQENMMMRQNCSPMFIDFGSLLPLSESNNGLTSLEQFKRCFFNVMMLRAKKPELDTIIRMICYDKGSIKDEEYLAMTGEHIEVPYGNRPACLRLFKSLISKLEFVNKKGFWSGYHKDKDFGALNFSDSDDTRAEMVCSLLKFYRPSTVIDIASNAGKFAIMAARLGAKVYAFDIDAEAIDRLHHRATEAGPDIALSVGIHGIYKGDRYDFWRRPLDASGEMAFSFAISHHIFITQKLPMDFIARTLSAYSQKTLVSEFMPYGLGNTKYHPNPLPKGYSLMRYIDAFSGIYRRVKVIYYPALSHWSFRILLIFEDKLADHSENQEIEKAYHICYTNKFNKPDFVLRVLCPECDHIFHVETRGCVKCPRCAADTHYDQAEDLFGFGSEATCTN